MFIIFNYSLEKVEAKDIWLGEDYSGVYWAMGETFEHLIDEEGNESDFCEIDFKIVSKNGNYRIFHCIMWSNGSYKIDNGEMRRPKQSPHPMYNLYIYTLNRIRNGDF